MSLVLKADGKRLVLVYIRSAIIIAIGCAVFSVIPASAAVLRYALLTIAIIAVILGLLEVHLRRVELSNDGVYYRSLFGGRFVPMAEISDWKIAGGGGSGPNRPGARLQFTLAHGAPLHITGISKLGVSDIGSTSREIAKYFKKKK